MAMFDDKGKAQSLMGSSKEGDYYVVRAKDTSVWEYGNPDWVGTDVVESHVDTYVDAGGIEKIIIGEGGKDVVANRNVTEIIGNSANNTIWGGQGTSRIDGGVGDDSINGGIFNDTLTGGAGADTFNFGDDGNWNASTITYTDTITDFNPALDRIVLNTADFKSLRPGFTFGVAQKMAGVDTLNFQLIYCQENGGLYYNPNLSKKDFGAFPKVNGTFVHEDGGLFVIFEGKPRLGRKNIFISPVDPKKVVPFKPTNQSGPFVS